MLFFYLKLLKCVSLCGRESSVTDSDVLAARWQRGVEALEDAELKRWFRTDCKYQFFPKKKQCESVQLWQTVRAAVVEGYGEGWGVLSGKGDSASLWLRMSILKFLNVRVEFSTMCGEKKWESFGLCKETGLGPVHLSSMPPLRCGCCSSWSLGISSSTKPLSLGASIQHSSGLLFGIDHNLSSCIRHVPGRERSG